MYSKLYNQYQKYREQLMYLVFGVLTTVINYTLFFILYLALGDEKAAVGNIICFIAATAFAYITNKIFVFNSKEWNLKYLIKELTVFVNTRLFSFAIEEAGIWVCVDILHTGRYRLYGLNGTLIAKIILSLCAVIINYFFSKYLVFKKKEEV